MKNLFSIVLLIIFGLLAYNHFTKTYTEDEQYLIDVKADFKDAQKEMKQSERAAATSGVDATSSYEHGLEIIRDIRKELLEYLEILKDEVIVGKTSRLLREINEFLTPLGYPPEPQ
ncbi:MAG: hypothetical protein KAR14_16105 [Candidatus Aminicenantes bacterium]|nr:hypothetical protein [Candidatus Aminicenantes bacterium]